MNSVYKQEVATDWKPVPGAAVEGVTNAQTGRPTFRERDAISYAEAEPDKQASLLGEHWMFAGGWNAMIGPTGQGKTSLSLQGAVLWSVGRPLFGIAPPRPLTIVVVQVENDDSDLSEMFRGIMGEVGLTEEERELCQANLHIITPPQPEPDLFVAGHPVAVRIEELRPDMLVLDSLYKFLRGGTATNPEDMVNLIDRTLLPLCRKIDGGLLVSHHMGRTEVLRLSDGDGSMLSDLYAGAGGMFVADSARGTLLLVPKEDRGQYLLKAAKRGARIGWRSPGDGERIYEKHIAWAEGHVGWREIDSASAAKDEDDRKRAQHRRKLEREFDHVRWGVRECGGEGGEFVLRKDVAAKCEGADGPLPSGMRERKLRDVVATMIADGLLIEDTEKKSRKAKLIAIP